MTVVLLCHCDGASGSTTFTDETGFHALTASGVTVNTAAPKFGTGAADFTSGSTAFINTGSNETFGAGPFTVEAWGYLTSAPTGVQIIMGNYVGSSNLGWDFGFVSGPLAFYYSLDGSTNLNVGGAYTPALNTWIHFAADRDASNVLRVYANGAVIASATVAGSIFRSIQTIYLGNDHNGNRGFPGRLDEIRITVGVAQYGGAFTPPSAPFTAPAPSSNTVWNRLDSLNTLLSAGNVVAQGSGATGGVRSVDKQIAGKFYWECTFNQWSNGSTNAGVACAACILNKESGGGPTTGMAAVYQSGAIWQGTATGTYVNSGSTLGTRAGGDIIGIAADFTARLIWFRVAPSGNWNGSATANPATGVGGVAIPAGPGFALYAIASFQVTQDTITANFGDSAFTGAVPSGFTSGFPAGASPATNAIVTQAALEEWSVVSPAAQVTQVGLEQWITVASVGVQAVVTQVSLEEWGSVATFGIAAGAGEADAAATVTGVGVAFTPPGVGRGEADAGATVTGTGATIQVAVGTGEADAGADVEGAGFVGAIGAGEADAFADVRGMGALIAPPNALPFLPGLGWSVHRRPTFSTIVAPHASGAEVRLALWPNALWEFELTYDALASNAAYPGAATNSLQTLMGFYLARGGQSGTFLYIDPDFNTATGQTIGVGDGATLAFPFIRAFGGQIEPVSFVTAVNAVYLDGVLTGGWTAAGATLTFAAAPASGVQVSSDFGYGFICRFLEDEIDFEEFMDNLWQLKSLKFRQVRL